MTTLWLRASEAKQPSSESRFRFSCANQALSPSLVVLRHVSGVLGNLSRVIVASSSDEGGPPRWKSRITVFDALKRLAYVDDQVR